jgi:predicted transcriptional regulator
MPINSSINSIDKSMSLYDAINILVSKELEELLIWDPQKCKWIWMLTMVDAIRFITHAL